MVHEKDKRVKRKNKELQIYAQHVKEKKDFYFGKDEYIYRFYEGQWVLLCDLKLHGFL